MADTQNKVQDAPKPTDAQKSDAEAKAAEAKAQDAQVKADNAAKSPEQRAADDARAKADDARAVAEQTRAQEAVRNPVEPTTAYQAKADSAVFEPDRPIGDHHAQRFSNTPENPPLVPGLNPDAENKVKLTMETSDSLTTGEPMVCYVNSEMVGDYLRAGWSRA